MLKIFATATTDPGKGKCVVDLVSDLQIHRDSSRTLSVQRNVRIDFLETDGGQF